MSTFPSAASAYDRWFVAFCSSVSAAVWKQTARARAHGFHGGLACWQKHDPMSRRTSHLDLCHECTGAHHSTLLALARKAWPVVSAGRDLDLVDFARRNAIHRFGGAVAKDNGAETGALQKVRRSVYDAKWIGAALDDDPVDLAILVQVLYFVHGHDRPEPGSLLPLGRFAARLEAQTGISFSRSEIGYRIDRILARLRAAKPNWVNKNIDARTSHLTGIGSWEPDDAERSDIFEPTAPESPDGELHLEMFELLSAAGELVRTGADLDASLRRVLEQNEAAHAIAILEGGEGWEALLAEVADLARQVA